MRRYPAHYDVTVMIEKDPTKIQNKEKKNCVSMKVSLNTADLVRSVAGFAMVQVNLGRTH